jgi:integrase
MTKLLERHNITDNLYVYLQDNSKYWYCRFVIFRKWYAKATKKTNKDEAIAMAHRILLDYQIRAETNTLVESKRFKVVAEKAIEKMETELLYGGKVSYRDYIGTLRKYHIPFFDRTYITSIDQEMILEFDKDRRDKFKRIPARSTLQTHNAALMMVFKEAIDRKWMLPIQVPVLNTIEGTSSKRRASFSKEEYEQVFDAVASLEQNSRTEKTRQIRELLLSYMEFAVHTGIRPGTEMEGITWGDIKMHRDEHNVVFYVTITKGKTTKYTGTREVVCRDEIFGCIDDLRDRFPNRKAKDMLFRLSDGQTTKELGKAFDKAVVEIDLKNSPHGVRTLYSLRHSYITWQLMTGEVSMEILAKQCGTSVQMIEQHYSHVVPKMFTRELSGVDISASKPKKEKHLSPEFIAKTQKRQIKQFKEWELEYKNRGCI